MALFVLIAALYIQKRELVATRSIISQQKFESTFFELLKSFNDQIHSLILLNYQAQDKKLITDQAQQLMVPISRGYISNNAFLDLIQDIYNHTPIFHLQEMNELLFNFKANYI